MSSKLRPYLTCLLPRTLWEHTFFGKKKLSLWWQRWYADTKRVTAAQTPTLGEIWMEHVPVKDVDVCLFRKIHISQCKQRLVWKWYMHRHLFTTSFPALVEMFSWCHILTLELQRVVVELFSSVQYNSSNFRGSEGHLRFTATNQLIKELVKKISCLDLSWTPIVVKL